MEIIGLLFLIAIIVELGPFILVIVIIAAIIFGIKKYLGSKEQKKSLQRKRVYNPIDINIQQNNLLNEVLRELHLENIKSLLREYDDRIMVKSAQSLYNYSEYQYLRETNKFETIKKKLEERRQIAESLSLFLRNNNHKTKPHYDYVERQLNYYLKFANSYRVLVLYITTAGNNGGQRVLYITISLINKVKEHPEFMMSKAEYNKYIRQQEKQKLDAKKHIYYDRVNSIISDANNLKEIIIVKSVTKILDKHVQELFEKTVNCIQKVKVIDSDEWRLLDTFITMKENEIKKIVQDDKQIREYYASEDFAKIKDTCSLLIESQKEFNEYIEEKAASITKLFGTRVVRNETQNEYVYNYIRAYKKSIEPFTAEVSNYVFGNAERNPIDYIIKYFYPNKGIYKKQIQNLRILIEELETLSEAKVIIDNYKKEYDKYIQNVPEYVMEQDEEGFYSRLGLAIIDEAVLTVEYKFAYTSDGGLVQRSFTVPMNEETITELINRLENRLSLDALAKEQRALMTSKLRAYIKERDNYTCCQCGNSIYAEPNLLLEIDHIIPISRGGLTQEKNLQTLCWKCNRSKGTKINAGYA